MRWKSFVAAVVTILLLRSLDLYITFRYTPDLAGEWNPLVSLFGLSWTGFLVIQVIIVMFISSLMFFYFNRKPVTVEQAGLSYIDFVYVYFFGKLRPWPGRMFSMPTNFNRHLVFNGFVFMSVTSGISVFAIVHNLLLTMHHSAYVKFVADNFAVYFPSCFLFVTIASVHAFFAIEYASYRSSDKNAGLTT